jgi:hypothetical protein
MHALVNWRRALAFATLILLPSVAHAQATLAGTLRDSSGGVLPGVAVEAASSVLIQGARPSPIAPDSTASSRCLPARTG